MDNEQSKVAVQEIVPLFYVDDIMASVAFYTGTLGFQRHSSWEPAGVLSWCRLERNGAAVMLQSVESEEFAGKSGERGRGIVFFFNCDNVDEIRNEFQAKGLDLAEPDVAFYGMKQVEFTDPDGYQLCFQSPVSDDDQD